MKRLPESSIPNTSIRHSPIGALYRRRCLAVIVQRLGRKIRQRRTTARCSQSLGTGVRSPQVSLFPVVGNHCKVKR